MKQAHENLHQIRLGHVKNSSLCLFTCGHGSLLKGELPFPVGGSSGSQMKATGGGLTQSPVNRDPLQRHDQSLGFGAVYVWKSNGQGAFGFFLMGSFPCDLSQCSWM